MRVRWHQYVFDSKETCIAVFHLREVSDYLRPETLSIVEKMVPDKAATVEEHVAANAAIDKLIHARIESSMPLSKLARCFQHHRLCPIHPAYALKMRALSHLPKADELPLSSLLEPPIWWCMPAADAID